MVDERKVRLMTQLARYEQTQGKEDFKISSYYRKDYTGMHMITGALWVTVGYVCLAVLIVFGILDTLLANLTLRMLIVLAIIAILGYALALTIYIILANVSYNKKHKDARQRVKIYNHNLTRLLRMYQRGSK